MRTNIELNDDLLTEAQKYSRAKTKRALVEEALTAFIKMRTEERRRRTYKDRLKDIRAKASSVRLTSDSREIVRKDRESR